MNRFDRVTSILLLLQTRSVVTAGFLSEHFSVTERTIYRDIRTLENAGVPIGSEAGVGYFLEKGYHLPPVSFTLDEAASLLIGEKLLASRLDPNSLQDYKLILNKVRAVLNTSDKDYLSSLDTDVEVLYTGQTFAKSDAHPLASHADSTRHTGDIWLRECRGALVRRQVVELTYRRATDSEATARNIEPIGLFYYSQHWHLIGWCRLRKDYRDFRLDRIQGFSPKAEQFARHSRSTLQQYLTRQQQREQLTEVELLFSNEAAVFAGEQRYTFGLVSEEHTADGVHMCFLTTVPDYMARWLLQFASGVRIVKGDELRKAVQALSEELAIHWKADQ